jgi:hypothetical protein
MSYARLFQNFLIILLVIISLSTAGAQKSSTIDTRRYADVCVQPGKSMYTPIKDKDGRGHAILQLAIQVSTLQSILTKDSPQHKAMCWMMYDDPRKVDPRGNASFFLDRFVLVTLYINTKGPGWVRSDYWLSKESHCNWHGVSCARRGLFLTPRVVGLDLSFNKVSGYVHGRPFIVYAG